MKLGGRAGRVPGGTIVLSQERTKRSRTIPSFKKKNEHLEPVLKNIGTISKRTEWNGTGIAWKERLKSLMPSYFYSTTKHEIIPIKKSQFTM